LAEASDFGYDKERALLVVMLKSVDSLRLLVGEPLLRRHGPNACVLTTELHGLEVRGLAYSPGRVMRYVLNNESKRLQTSVLMRLARSRREPAA
jgi:hypothetical protein|tara:strand:- start:20 stop:301 length:282 start_codon:yes stop_codon:yes gene_type:complete